VWQSEGRIHEMDAATGASSAFEAGLMFVKAADSRDVFGADSQLNIVAIDLATGRSRVVSPSTAWSMHTPHGDLPGLVTLHGARYALSGEYVYVAWHPDQGLYGYLSSADHVRRMTGPHDIGTLSRVKRDGSSAPELVGAGPDGRFVLDDDHAYYGARWEGLKRRSLVRGPLTEAVWAAPEVEQTWMLGISDGQAFFGILGGAPPRYTLSIASVPLGDGDGDGGKAQPQIHVPSAGLAFREGILEGDCVYANAPDGVMRANLADASVQRLVEGHPVPGDATTAGSTFLATDGRFLYWADYGGDSILRWSR
jgi:hypothetical protein